MEIKKASLNWFVLSSHPACPLIHAPPCWKKKNLMGNQFNIKTFKYNTNMYKSSRSATDLQLIQPLHLLLSNRVEYTIRSVLNISNSVTL